MDSASQGSRLAGEAGGGKEGAGESASRHLSSELQEGYIRCKRTFLDCRSPMVGAWEREAYFTAEAERPKSDPTSSSSSSASSLSDSFSLSNGHAVANRQRRLRDLEDFADNIRQKVPENWTEGAKSHESGQCRPCKFFAAGKCKKESKCAKCHLQHEVSSTASGGFKRDRYRAVVVKTLTRARAEGDAFNFHKARWIPRILKINHNRATMEKMCETVKMLDDEQFQVFITTFNPHASSSSNDVAGASSSSGAVHAERWDSDGDEVVTI